MKFNRNLELLFGMRWRNFLLELDLGLPFKVREAAVHNVIQHREFDVGIHVVEEVEI